METYEECRKESRDKIIQFYSDVGSNGEWWREWKVVVAVGGGSILLLALLAAVVAGSAHYYLRWVAIQMSE